MREGKIPFCKLEDIMNDMQSSSFNPQRLIEWIDNKQAEVKELEVRSCYKFKTLSYD